MNKLYKLTNTGKIQEWSIEVFDDEVPYHEVTFGQQGGKLTTKRTNFKSGKNIGRANETTAFQQCKLEAGSLWTKQKERKGYTEEIPTEKPLRPMLAKEYKKDGKHIIFPCYGQVKLDGLRAIFVNGKLMSRENKEFTSLPHIIESLRDCSMALDGELYSHELTFQEILSIIKRDDIHPDHKKISYYVYDIVDEKKDFAERAKIVNDLSFDFIKPVESFLINSPDEIAAQHDEVVSQGYEGLMLRNLAGAYKVNGRSKDLQKYKEFMDQEFKIVDVVESDRHEGCGKYVCEHRGETFPVTPKCTEVEKRHILENKREYIGKMLTVRFFGWTTSASPSPRFPVGICVRDYE
jgi:DNA ligase-1